MNSVWRDRSTTLESQPRQSRVARQTLSIKQIKLPQSLVHSRFFLRAFVALNS